MSDYIHPQRDAEFVLNELVQFDQLCEAWVTMRLMLNWHPLF